jgi:hypothetical protein
MTFVRNELGYELTKEQIRKDKAACKKSIKLSKGISRRVSLLERRDMLMAKIMFKGPGSRHIFPNGTEREITCKHPPLSESMGAIDNEIALRWFFKQHKDADSAFFCLLRWLDRMVEIEPEATAEFCISRFDMLESIWKEELQIENSELSKS